METLSGAGDKGVEEGEQENFRTVEDDVPPNIAPPTREVHMTCERV